MAAARPRIHNECTTIRDFMQITGRKNWGFVIYRCTYADDAAWATFLDILNHRVRDAFAEFPPEDSAGLWETLDWNVQSDPATLDGASKAEVRARFNAWLASDEAVAEQGTGSVVPPDSFAIGPLCARHACCVHVDAESLSSVVDAAPRPPTLDMQGIGYVNFIKARWTMPNDVTDQGYEPVEGCTLHNVGWMKVSLDSLAPNLYSLLQKDGTFELEYVRPPAVCVR